MNLNNLGRAAFPVGRAACILFFLVHLLACPGAWVAPSEAFQPAPSAPRTPAGPVDAEALASALYAAGPLPPWLSADRARAQLALDLISNASAQGLNPEYYGAEELARRLAGQREASTDAEFERDLSTAMLQLLADFHYGRTALPLEHPAGCRQASTRWPTCARR